MRQRDLVVVVVVWVLSVVGVKRLVVVLVVVDGLVAEAVWCW